MTTLANQRRRETLATTFRKTVNNDLKHHFLDVAQLMVVVLDSQGRITLINQEACNALGYPADQLIGRDWFDLCIPDNERNQERQVFRQVVRGAVDLAEHYTTHVVTASGELRLIDWHNSLRHDDEHNICGTISSGTDITEQGYNNEKKAHLYEQTHNKHKLEALGHFTSGIAHDFNNFLASILGYADLTLDSVKEMNKPELERYLSEIINEGEKARDLVTQMLAFTRGDKNKGVALNPVPLIKELAKIIRISLPETIELNLNMQPDIPKLLINPIQLHQVILDLCLNACDDLKTKGGHITLNINRMTCHHEACNACHKVFDGDYVEIAITEDGHVITPSLLEHTIDESLKADDDGIMGLATIANIIHDSDGHIRIESVSDHGTTFRLLLPVAP
jgi:PAS domain S-box-containing protein